MHYATFVWLKEQAYKFFFPAGRRLAVRWDDEAAFPPLDPRQAALLAGRFIDTHLPDSGRSLQSISLKKAWGPDVLDQYWYYIVEFAIPDLKDFNDSELVQVPVLMDGSLPKFLPVAGVHDQVPRPQDA